MLKYKKGTIFEYRSTSDNKESIIKAKKICSEKGMVKCKVITKDWYKEIYLTENDFYSGKAKVSND